jgi:hypothetical protein
MASYCSFNDVKWDGDKLVVLDSVYIRPPYAVSDVFQLPSSKHPASIQTVEHIKKVVSIILCCSIVGIYRSCKLLVHLSLVYHLFCC